MLAGKDLLRPPEQAQWHSAELILATAKCQALGATQTLCPYSMNSEPHGMGTQTGRCAGRSSEPWRHRGANRGREGRGASPKLLK